LSIYYISKTISPKYKITPNKFTFVYL